MKRESVLPKVLVLVIAVALFAFPMTAGASELHVGPGQTYSTISAAVVAASESDTIIVHDAGTDPDYEENVEVNIEHLTIREADGEDVTVKAADAGDHVFEVTADYIAIRGLDIYGATGMGYAGIYLNGVSGCTIENNRCGWADLYANYYGIKLYSSSGNILSGNTCYENSYGILLYYSSHNTLSGNICPHNGAGIWVYSSSDNTLWGNTCNENAGGIALRESSNNNTISGNTCNENCFSGIELLSSSNNNNMISGNTCSNNWYDGIRLEKGSNYNTLSGNTANSNTRYGIVLDSSSDNTIYFNNFRDNTTANVWSDSTNTWHSPTTIYYSYASMHKNFLGNYYSDYGGSDPDGDGIGNAPYDLPDPESADSFPLMATSDDYPLQAWWLHSDGKMYIDDMTRPGGSITIIGGYMKAGQVVWTADQITTVDIDFTGGADQTWTGQVVFTSALASGHTFTIEMGSWDGGSFTAGGPDATLTGDGSKKVFTYETDNQLFTVTAGNYLALKIINNSGSSYDIRTGGAWSYTSSPEGSMGYPTGVEEESDPAGGEAYFLSQNYPNPFFSQTTIYYQIPKDNFVSLNIYNVAGRLIRTLVNERKRAGSHTVYWDGKDGGGKPVSTGMYFCQIKAGCAFTSIKKMILLK